ncbi:hypothetical protein DFH07DRAFT_756061 [Mycena maculata]|uniref:Uncharacterized protein n=1 Tax=Mycena maculata TaxID=230809 RepID=A0AAD7MT55_9AGAR|nr:hypothetical protein DFH07DRAFT_756061 [Mycena maculata]
MDPDDWQVPDLNIAYSRGAPTGRTLVGQEVLVRVLVDDQGCMVPCSVSHSTCTQDVQKRLTHDREERLQYASPSKDIFCRTSSYISALRKFGCSRPLAEPTLLSPDQQERAQLQEIYLQQVQRGLRPRDGKCQGRLLFEHDIHGNAHISRCEHFDKKTSRDHFYDPNIGAATGTYDLEYIEAVFNSDKEEVAHIEDAAFTLGYGPLVECTTIANVSSQKAFCPFDHRTSEGELIQPLMERLGCCVKFRVYEPLEEFRTQCPYILITSSGAHTHPIPLPTRTPPSICAQVFQLLEDLGEDLPDITPRRFIRHPIVRAFLTSKFPQIPRPTLSDLHISLANRSHLKAFIKQIKELHYPLGTGWEAVKHLKRLQDAGLPPAEHYIRRIISLDINTVDQHEEDEDDPLFKDTKLRIIVCMSPKASHRLLRSGRYLQSDIAFKRIMEFLEFEMASMERDANTSLTFCRVFLNRQSAVAHQHVFAAIEDIVFEDTGKRLRWRHLHANNLEEHEDMILEWAADQHRGQAKGLGLHLQTLAATMTLKSDLHEPDRYLQDLSPYDHLRRVFRLCSNHYYRNIKSSAVSDECKHLMRSLLCLRHENWEATLAAIEEKGGKTGSDWLRDKIHSKFVFPAICWERSFIPELIWRAGDSNTNLIESVHRDVNHDGVHCTLLGGLQKGQAYDSWKIRTLEIYETYGIRPTYRSGHISENAFTNLRRRDNAQRKRLLAADSRIEKLNVRLETTHNSLLKARHAIREKIQNNLARHDISIQLTRLATAADKALDAHLKLVEEGKDLANTGTGHVSVHTFDITP